MSQIQQFLKDHSITEVEAIVPDMAGVARGKVMPADRYAEDEGMRLPESIFLFTDTLLVFDHLQHKIQVVSHFRLDGDIEAAYRQAAWRIEELVRRARASQRQVMYHI